MKEALLWLNELLELSRIDNEAYQMIISQDSINADEFYEITFIVLKHGFCNLFIELIKQHQNIIRDDQYQEFINKIFVEDVEKSDKDIFEILRDIRDNK